MMRDYDVNMDCGEGCDFTVVFKGPKDSACPHTDVCSI